MASKIKDSQFKSSFQFAIGLFAFPIYYLIVITLFCILTDVNLLKLIFAITLPVTALFSFYNYQYIKKLTEKFRIFRLKHLKAEQYNILQSERNHIIDIIKTTINNNQTL